MDPIAELLSQLSGVRRGLGASGLGSVLGLGALGSLGGALGSLGGMNFDIALYIYVLFHGYNIYCSKSKWPIAWFQQFEFTYTFWKRETIRISWKR